MRVEDAPRFWPSIWKVGGPTYTPLPLDYQEAFTLGIWAVRSGDMRIVAGKRPRSWGDIRGPAPGGSLLEH